MASAPGRVNLLGEHTDYNDGFVLPIAIPQRTTVSLGAAPDGGFTVHSRELRETVRFTLADGPAAGFARYVFGCLREFAASAPAPASLAIHVASDVPMTRLSSSAALEVATRGVAAAFGRALTRSRLAHGTRAEIEYGRGEFGIMDQWRRAWRIRAGAVSRQPRWYPLVPLPPDAEVLVLAQLQAPSRSSSTSVGWSAAGMRVLGVGRSRCERRAALAGAEPLMRRARQVVS